jgi:hypothetical protein
MAYRAIVSSVLPNTVRASIAACAAAACSSGNVWPMIGASSPPVTAASAALV